MDFEDIPDEAAFRADARAFLEANAERRRPGEVEGYRRGQDVPGAMERAKAFQRNKAAAGFVGIHWPKEWGGRGGTQIQHVIYNQEKAQFDVLSSIFGIGINLAVPTICACGSEAQRERFVKPTMCADIVWCQLFSEPSGGSDLASLRTRAERDGDGWVINGQKIWNSGAHYSDFGILVARSDPNVPKHAGLTYFILDMKAPGVEVRPIKQISGTAHFNEVFFTDVRIPDAQRLGSVARRRHITSVSCSDRGSMPVAGSVTRRSARGCLRATIQWSANGSPPNSTGSTASGRLSRQSCSRKRWRRPPPWCAPWPKGAS